MVNQRTRNKNGDIVDGAEGLKYEGGKWKVLLFERESASVCKHSARHGAFFGQFLIDSKRKQIFRNGMGSGGGE